MPKRWQYQRLAKPITPPGQEGERINADKWQPQVNIPQSKWKKRALFSIAVLTPFLFFDPLPITAQENVTLDKWEYRQQQPAAKAKQHQRIYQNYFAPVRQPDVSLDKYYQPASEPRRDIKRQQYIYPTFWTDTHELFVPLDRWAQPVSQPRFDRKRSQYQYPAYVSDTHELFVPLDRWVQPIAQPLFDRQRTQNTYETFFNDQFQGFQTAAEVVTLDKWFVRANEPVRIRARLREYPPFWIDARQLTQPERSTPDKWHPLQNQPRMDVKRWQFLYPNFFPSNFVESVTLDKWFQGIEQPYLVREDLTHLYPTISFGPQRQPDVSLNSWFQETQRPIWTAPRATEFPAFTNDPFSLTQAGVGSISDILGMALFIDRQRDMGLYAEVSKTNQFHIDGQRDMSLSVDVLKTMPFSIDKQVDFNLEG